MCNFKSGFYTIEDLEFYYGATFGSFKVSEQFREEFVPHYYENAFDHLSSPVMIAPGQFGFFSWGLVPPWTKSMEQALAIRNDTINAKSEEMYEKSSYIPSLKENRRCLIPSNGFFEWKWANPDAPAGKKVDKQPYFIHTKNKLFSFAGIWSTWIDKTRDKEIHTYSVLTCEPNELMREIHNRKKRMPVIIPDEYLKDWLNPNLTKQDVLALCRPFDAKQMDAYTIDKKIGNPKIPTSEKDTVEIMQRVDAPPLSTETGTKIKAKKLKGDPGQGSLF